MRILIYSKPFYPSVGGVESTSRLLARALQELGHAPVVVTTTPIGRTTERNEGYPVVRSAAFGRLWQRMLNSDLMISKGGLSVLAGLAALLARKPFVVWHEMSGALIPASDGAKGFCRGLLQCRLLRYASIHVGVSRSCLSSKSLPPAARSTVIYNAIAPELESAAARCSEAQHRRPVRYDLLYVGSIIRAKGLFILAEALRRYCLEKGPLDVAFVGRGVDEDELKARLSGIPGLRASFPGPKDAESLAAFYEASRCVVVPSTRPEGMGLVAAEALAFGVPVIVSDQAALREVIGEGGVIFRNEDAGDLLSCIARILASADQQRIYACAGLLRSKTFTYATFKQRVSDLLAGLERGSAN
jgi:glycogen synthase